MHRPNRIGCHAVVDLGLAQWNPAVTGFDSDESKVFPKVRTATPGNFGLLRYYEDTITIGANEEFSVAVPLIGTRDQLRPFMFNFVGHAHLHAASAVPYARPFIARADSDTLDTALNTSNINDCSNPWFLPGSSQQQTGAGGLERISVRETIIDSDEAGGTHNDNPILVGFQFWNPDASGATALIDCSIMAWRYTADIDTQDSR